MEVLFKIHYNTKPGEQICISGAENIFGNWRPEESVKLNYSSNGIWSVSLRITDGQESLDYKYYLADTSGNIIWEWGKNRNVRIGSFLSSAVVIHDQWRYPSNEEKVLFSSALRDVVFRRPATVKGTKQKGKRSLHFRISAPRVSPGIQLCISGEGDALGNWDIDNPVLLECKADTAEWFCSVNAEHVIFPLQYKYGLYDISQKKLVAFETGFNREIKDFPTKPRSLSYIRTDESFRYPYGPWKGAGVAVPVFSLRSEKGFGVGEFSDLTDFIDWAKMVGLRMVQILPVNETIATHSWLDSYPYKSISVFALHPIYLNLQKMGALQDKKKAAEFAKKQKALNLSEYVDYPEVHRLKSAYYKLLFDQEKEGFFNDPEYQSFFRNNKDWLVPYAAFAYLRDKMKTADFRLWGKNAQYNKKNIEKISKPGSEAWDDIAIHYFLQFHLDKQLKEVSAYARKNGIVLKGDIPIGISPNSVEAWTEPELFKLDAQAGAPPDAFAIKGQNWGFPTYNWEKMAQDGYSWWQKRLQKMAEYFDAYRIDHILGFFRIWEIPMHAVEGVLGVFNPALPLSAEEISSYGIPFDYDRMVSPYIRHHLLAPLFGVFTEEVILTFLDETGFGSYKMKDAFNSQKKVNDYFLKDLDEEHLSDKNRRIRDGLFELLSSVLFIEDGFNGFHPRITLQLTASYAELSDEVKFRINELYNHYFYKRHDNFWYHKGMEKLPGIIAASEMLVCGEDLGMVPDCVHPVMNKLGILSLEIQRMSKNPKQKFAHPANAPYLSVCTTSTHDMSTTRGWWEESRELIQAFYNDQLGNSGSAPFYAEPWLCQQVINQHMHSPAMWTTFPVQDLIAMDGELRWEKTHEEKINEPSNVRHHWKYRMFQSIRQLKNAGYLNELIKRLIGESGRDRI